MSAPLPIPLISPAQPPKASSSADRNSANNSNAPSFSKVLAKQNNNAASTQDTPKRPAVSSKESKPAPTTSAANESDVNNTDVNQQTLDQAAAMQAAAALAAQTSALPPPVPQEPALTLPEQALEIAQVAAQVQLIKDSMPTPAVNAELAAAAQLAAQQAKNPPQTTIEPQNLAIAQAALAQQDTDADAQMLATAAPAQQPAASKAAPQTEAHPTMLAQAPTPVVSERAPNEPGDTRYIKPAPHTELPTARNNMPAGLPQQTEQQAQPHDSVLQAIAANAIQPPPGASTAPPTMRIPVPGSEIPVLMQVGTPVSSTRQWGNDLSQQMVLLSSQTQPGSRQTAELRLDPPDLGPLRITLSLNDGIASAAFVSAHASVRQAVEAAMPQLQQALAQAGISLGQTSVGEQNTQQQEFAQQAQQHGFSRSQTNQNASSEGAVQANVANNVPAKSSDGLIDTFA